MAWFTDGLAVCSRVTKMRLDMIDRTEAMIRSKMSFKVMEYFLEHPDELERVLTTIPEKENPKS